MAGKVFLGVKIRSDVNDLMRKTIPARKGSISSFIEEAILEKLERDYGVRL